MKKMVTLASTSPRRTEILNYFTLPFEIKPPCFDESTLPFEGNPLLHVRTLSEKKALSVTSLLPILGADTIVYKEGKIYEKPAHEEEALEMLRSLNGAWHTVYTALTIVYKREVYTEVETTEVLFHQLDEEKLLHYHRALQHKDKAGGYAIQQSGGLIVKAIKGCYYNVMGLPLNALTLLLKKVNIDLWDYLD